MVQVIEGNLFDSHTHIIAHQVNCQGAMNSGVAKQVRERFPHVFEMYKKIHEKLGESALGEIQIAPINPEFVNMDTGEVQIYPNAQYICNMFAQAKYGYDGKQYTDLWALKNCMIQLKNLVTSDDLYWRGGVIAMPWKIGCVRGGADWERDVLPMINEVLGDCSVELWKLPEGGESNV